jgi:hypothetical protein
MPERPVWHNGCKPFVSLRDIDFVINPYDPCAANKKIEGEQMTICFHVDD